MISSAPSSGGAEAGERFVSTRWTLVVSAGRQSSPQSDAALAELCRTYWYPLYAFVRRQGHTREDAEDLVQAFFAGFLRKNYLAELSSERGKFRAFLLTCLKHFLANEWDKASRQKRGGTTETLSLDWHLADERYQLEPADVASPDRLYDREWALELLERVISRLREEYVEAGKAELFQHAKGFLLGRGEGVPHAQAAAALGMEEGALRVAVHRLRGRYRQLLRDEIAQTLLNPAMADEELSSLRLALQT